MRIVFCWLEISGYMAACWRALAARPGIDLKVIAFAPNASGKAPFSPEILRGVDHHLLDAGERADAARVAEHVVAAQPDAVFIAGWMHAPYLKLLRDNRLANARFGMMMDTPWNGSLRQRLGWLKLATIVKRLHRVVVAGERAFILARHLGITEDRIRAGSYGYDDALFAPAFELRRQAGAHPKRFLFTGMYDRRKGLDVTLQAYTRYRAEVTDPWPLTCCGKGELDSLVTSAAGVENRGFVQPADLPAIFAAHGAFVISSRFEPWGVVIAEAMASGMPVICTTACGASVELVRSYYNGITFAADDAVALTRALKWMHTHYDQLPEMGLRGRQFAQAHSASLWAQRIEEMLAD